MPKLLAEMNFSKEFVIGAFSCLLLLLGVVYLTNRSFENGAAPITYETRQAYGDGDAENEIEYVAVTGGARPWVIDKVNRAIYDSVVAESCFGDPKAPDAKQFLADLYKNRADAGYFDSVLSQAELNGMSFSDLKEYLSGSVGATSWSAVEYAKNGVLSIAVSFEEYCGGAHPNYGAYALNFDMATGELVRFVDLFENFEEDKQHIADIVFAESERQIAYDDDGCGYLSDGLDISDASVALGAAGIKPLSFGYSHAMAPCEPIGVTVPYALLNGYWRKDGLVSRILAAGAGKSLSADESFSDTSNETYEKAKMAITSAGWTVENAQDFVSANDPTYPEIGDCGSGLDAVCSVVFIRGTTQRVLYVQKGGQDNLKEWMVIGSEYAE